MKWICFGLLDCVEFSSKITNGRVFFNFVAKHFLLYRETLSMVGADRPVVLVTEKHKFLHFRYWHPICAGWSDITGFNPRQNSNINWNVVSKYIYENVVIVFNGSLKNSANLHCDCGLRISTCVFYFTRD